MYSTKPPRRSPIKLADKLSLLIAALALALSVVDYVRTEVDSIHKEQWAIRNAYSFGQVIAAVAGFDWVYGKNQRNAALYVSSMTQLDLLVQQYAQNLQIDPQRTQAFLKAIDQEQLAGITRANLLDSPARTLIEREIASLDLGARVRVAYDLGWMTSVYSQYCVLAERFETRDPSVTSAFVAAYPAIIQDLSSASKALGNGQVNLESNLPISRTCASLKDEVAALNRRFQSH